MRPDQADVERAVAGRMCPEPPADLRARILAAVAAESAGRKRTRRRWPAVWQVAAAVVLALNLALSFGNAFRYQALQGRALHADGHRPGPAIPADPDQHFRYLAVTVLAQLPPAPDAGPLGRHAFEQKEN